MVLYILQKYGYHDWYEVRFNDLFRIFSVTFCTRIYVGEINKYYRPIEKFIMEKYPKKFLKILITIVQTEKQTLELHLHD